jgi:TRAP-type C4-dicarboxylate transport system permease small subunit
MTLMRKALDRLYTGCAVASGCFLVVIGTAIALQVAARHVGKQIPSADDIAGLSMAASLFLGLAPTLRAGRHIRVNLLLSKLPVRLRKRFEVFVCLSGSVFFGYFSFYATQMTIESYQIGERTAGLLPIPLWLPQIGMSLGLIVMTLALLDDLVLAVGGRTPVYARSEEAQLEAEGLRRADGARQGV